ncbi:MAG TPA: glycoside hydrolase family 3 C-terminal domain-containing protein [Candidatus Merdivicinus excrementipullorum]|uniref:Glycoside hydrolase family 3 C-terminal domain-containing protein n=1 Tax=Candidatus Merdivicinus excrementipullorum TaxID=2840867 RepID=A0A9D1JZL4_9FIRM|nr:glycoside hydrolase family 3 C-terminal domain-containing protein [Candidatus Merdivicinus excrementipullorum]
MIYKDSSRSVEERVEDLLSRMTLEEKAAQLDMTRGVEYAHKPSDVHNCSVEADSGFDFQKIREIFGSRGVGFVHDTYSVPAVMNRLQKYFVEETRLGIPCIFTGEALHGISGTRGTIFPVPLGLGATFAPETVRLVGEVIGRETRALGMHEILAPNLDVAREPRWGRTEETFGEDTCLSSKMAAAIISGEQKDGALDRPDAVASEPKHYCVHGIPEGGTNCSAARAGEREIRRDYLPVFEAGIREGGACNVMASYNSIDSDVVMCSHKYLTDILKNEMGAQGYARSDWGGIGRIRRLHHLVRDDRDALCLAIGNGLDVQGCDLDNQYFEETLVSLVKEGRLPMERVDDAVRRVLRMKFRLGLFERPYTDETAWEGEIRSQKNRDIALLAARQSITLLKNDGVLPLGESVRSIALIGPSSAHQKIGGYSAVPVGYAIPSVYEELQRLVGHRVQIFQCDGCPITEGPKTEYYVEGQPHLFSKGEEEIADCMEQAVEIAAKCDVIVMVGGDNTITSGEGKDRCELTLAGKQRELIQKLSQLGKPLVLVLENGKCVDLSVEEGCCGAILAAWFGGEFGAQAIAEALLGILNPAGRLPVSFPQSSTRLPCYYSMLPGGDLNFMEGTKLARYPFGHGLSYTSFSYSGLKAELISRDPLRVSVSVTVRNTGNRDGEEVAQIYVDDVDSSVATPPLLLKDFQRVFLKAGEEKTLDFELDEKAFRLMGLDYRWTVEPGEFRILAGASSRDIRCETQIVLSAEDVK